MDILDKIVQHTHGVIAQRRATIPLAAIRNLAETAPPDSPSLKAKLCDPRPHIIAEFKRKSPSLPDINMNADPIEIAKKYQAGGASAISVLTEPQFFAGSLDDLKRIRQTVDLPILRKDFIVDPYQIYEAKAMGANLILLIGRILDETQIRDFCHLAHQLGMEVLFEIHHLTEWAKAENAAIDFLGVNCRDLTRFQTNLQMLVDMADKLPRHLPLVAESGIAGRDEVRRLHQAGYKLFLVGQYLMRGDDPAASLKALYQ